MKRFLSSIFFCLLISYELASAKSVLPKANLQLFPSTGTVGKEIIFDGSYSLNEIGKKYGLEYRFKVSSRTNWTQFSSNPKYKFTPTESGNFVVNMEVRDIKNKRTQKTVQNYKVRYSTDSKFARIKVLNQDPIRVGKEIFFEVIFSIPQNIDSKKVKTRWDFDSNGVFDTQYLSQKIVSHVYSKIGNFSPSVEILFPDGEKIKVEGIITSAEYNGQKRKFTKDRKKIKVLSAAIDTPILNISPGYHGYSENTTFRFDASRTKTTNNTWIEFHFDGESVIRNKKIISRKFTGAGKHQVLVLHCFNRKEPQCAKTQAFIEIDSNPTDYRVNFNIQDLSNSNYKNYYQGYYHQNFFTFTRNDKIRFSAHVFEKDILAKNYEYRWDFDGDGVFDTPFSYKNFAETQYDQAGKYNPKVEVKNEFTNKLKSVVSHQKTILIQKNTPPTASFKVKRISGKFTSSNLKTNKIYPKELVSFVVNTNDQESINNKIKVRFDLDGDNLWENDFAWRKTMNWQYEKPGEYKAKIQIQDHGKITKTITQKIIVSEFPEPQIKIKVSHKTGDLKTHFTFDASKSIGHNLRFYWEIPENPISQQYSNPQKTVLFKSTGKKNVSLKIVDSNGCTKQVSFPVFVEELLAKNK